ncbi:MAG: GDSL-type esterase/lipase family protein [Clostridiales bacterium]|jgi:lysophospholipase L1-like esterase|nr:GDSL-type esterase/lipase family protein [Clostridiales bacterium]
MKNKKKKVFLIVASVVLLLAVGGAALFSFTIGYPARLINAEKKLNALKQTEWKEDEILLCGSSFIEYWESSGSDLAPLTTYNLGVASTVISDWDKWVDKMIAPFKPRAVVLYVGSNDIHGSIGSKDGSVAAEEIKALLEKIREKTGAKLYYISIAPTVLRENVWDEAKECNEAVEKYCAEKEYLNFIDCTPALLDADGGLRQGIYRADKLHFNEKGYEIWKNVIAPVLIGDLYADAD